MVFPLTPSNFVEMPFPNMGDALVNRQVDAAMMVEPFVTLMMKRGTSIKPLSYPLLDIAPGLDIAGFLGSRKLSRSIQLPSNGLLPRSLKPTII
jgi:hypothetical protein